jgi:excisionase family DNA binding protein
VELWDVKQVASYLKVSESWIYKLVSAKGIPFQRAGRLVRFRKEQIDSWLEQRGSDDGVHV